MYLPFDQLPNSSRIWIYVSSRAFTAPELYLLQEQLKNFCETWTTHGELMPTSFTILHEQLVVLAVDESQLGPSGCSIDSSVRILKELEQRLGVNLVDQGKLTLRNESGKLQVLPGLGIKSRIQAGEIDPKQEVLHPSIQRKEALSGMWQPLSKSWLSSYFPI